jgi:asparagine synthase (glutamine-hydrolysing)
VCGICGIVDFSKHPGLPVIQAMTDTLRHRGPDDCGVVSSGAAAVGQTRLSIIELTDLGSQPMWTADRRFCLVYNGEVYNAPELREDLRREGCTFRGRSDTEVVLEALRLWGVSALERFNGMFALALWDSHEARLTLARDRFGIKPLYVAARPGGLLFGSEIKALLASRQLGRTVDPAGLHEFLYYGNALGRRTLFAGIHRLLPGEWTTTDAGGTSSGRYWTPAATQPVADDVPQACAAIREKLGAAVERHLESDVPVGAMLSGGIDSSAIVAFAAERCSGPLRTYTVGFDFPGAVNEFGKARVVADRFATEHTELNLSVGSVPDLLERVTAAHDQPFGDAANLPLLMIADALSGSVKVVLQGDGGDEMFAGYRRYNLLAFHRAFELAARGRRLLGHLPSSARVDRLDRILYAMGQRDASVRMALLLTQEKPSWDPLSVLAPGARSHLSAFDPFQRYREVFRQVHCDDPVQLMLLTDASILLPDIFLEKVDRPTMASALEVRVPMLDSDLATYAMGLPSNYKVRRLQKKWILRKSLESILPPSTLNGKKTGFGVPYGQWLRADLAAYARDRVASSTVPFDIERVNGLFDDHLRGTADHGFLLHKCLSLAVWSDMYGVDFTSCLDSVAPSASVV